MMRTVKARPRNIFIITATLFVSVIVFCGSPAQLSAMPPIKKFALENGLVVLVAEEHSLPFVTMHLIVDAGSSRDPKGKEGLSCLTTESLLAGTRKRSATEVSETLDFLGASLSTIPGRDFITIKFRVLKKDLDRGFALFAEAVGEPAFPEKEIKQEIVKLTGAIKSEEDDPGEYAEKEFQRQLFAGGPYGHAVEGTVDSLSALTGSDVNSFYNNHFRADRMVLAIVGDITGHEIETKILPSLAKLGTAKVPVPSIEVRYPDAAKRVSINRSITQANIVMGHKGLARTSPDYYAMSVLNYILGGGGFSSRLTNEIRSKRGLAYAVESGLDAGRYGGSFQINLQTKAGSAREAIGLAVKELERIRSAPVTEEELEGAKRYLIGSFPMRLDTQAKLAGFLVQTYYFGLGLDYATRYRTIIESITVRDLLRVAGEYLHPDKLITIVVGNVEQTGLDSSANN